MKPIIKSILFTAVLAMVLTGCQKEADIISVSLKSSVTPAVINIWNPAGGAAAECELAGSSCGYSYKVDPWAGGPYQTDGNTINITINPDGSFNFTSQYPVCKVIVKAGRGALIYSYSPGVYSDNNLWGYQAKGISHATFCYGAPEMVIAVKTRFTNDRNAVSPGNLVPSNLISGTGWCGEWMLGYMPFVAPSTFKLYYAGLYEEVGRVEIDINGDVKVFANDGLTLDFTYLYVGSLGALKELNVDSEGCPQYYTIPPWMFNDEDGISQSFIIP